MKNKFRFLSLGTLALATTLSLFPGHGKAAQALADTPPDVVINTKSLSKLPRDIVKIPVLKDLLTEDFVTYYQHGGADWLSIRGALVRLAYENSSDLPTQLLAWVFSSPAEVALWKSPNGKLNRFLLVMDQTGVKALMELFAKVATADKQLSKESSATTRAEVYSIQYGENRELYFAAEGGRLFIFSDLGMKLPDNAEARGIADRAKSFFGLNDDISVFGPKLSGQDHVITARMDYLSFGYQAFFSALRAIRFDARGGSWTTAVLTEGGASAMAEADWAVQPRGAAFCFGVPVNVEAVQSVLGTPTTAPWLKASATKATACWHADSKFYAPVVTVQGDFGGLIGKADELQPVFDKLIGAREAYWKLSNAESDTESVSATLAWSKKLPVVVAKTGTATTFVREVGGRQGLYPAKDSKQAALLTSSRFFRVKLAVTARALIFSPDDKLVDRALSTIDGKFPSMAASLATSEKGPSAIFSPAGFAKLAKQTVMDSLPASDESEFRAAASRHLFPNLDAMAKAPTQAAALDLGKQSGSKQPVWKPLKWTTHATR